MNPDSLNLVDGRFPDSVYGKFPHMLRKLSVLYLIVSLAGSLLVTEPKQAIKSQPRTIAKSTPAAPAALPQQWGLSVRESMKTNQFWLLWAMILTAATAGLNTASVYKQFAATSTALTGDEFQALVGGIGGALQWVRTPFLGIHLGPDWFQEFFHNSDLAAGGFHADLPWIDQLQGGTTPSLVDLITYFSLLPY